jgi:hypothetical protein
MPGKRFLKAAREIDKRWQRWRAPERRRLLVNARTAMNYATVRPIIERLQRDPRLEIYFTSSEDPARTGQIYAEASPPFELITPTMAAFRRFDVYLASDFLWVTLPRGTRRVQTFHGVAGKFRTVYDSPSGSMREWDRLFFINRRRLQHFLECGAIDADSDAPRLIGMPKLDCLVDGTLTRDPILTALGVDPARRTVLYAPTWSAHSSVVLLGEDLVERLGEAGYTVIVKLHDRSRDLQHVHSGGVDWGARLLPVLQRYGGVLATGSNSSQYLPAADVMITDHSSVGFEYLLLDRPLVRIHVPELIRQTDIEPSYVEMLAAASYPANDVEETVAAVESAFSEPGAQSADRVAVANEMFYLPGTATQRAVTALYELMELERLEP